MVSIEQRCLIAQFNLLAILYWLRPCVNIFLTYGWFNWIVCIKKWGFPTIMTLVRFNTCACSFFAKEALLATSLIILLEKNPANAQFIVIPNWDFPWKFCGKLKWNGSVIVRIWQITKQEPIVTQIHAGSGAGLGIPWGNHPPTRQNRL